MAIVDLNLFKKTISKVDCVKLLDPYRSFTVVLFKCCSNQFSQ